MIEERANLDSVRRRLLAAVAERKVSLAAASRAIGRNHSYLQQFVMRGTPRRLPEVIRHALAKFLDVDERTLRPPDDWISGAGAAVVTADRPLLSSFVARLAVARAESPFTAPSVFAVAAGIDRWRYGELEEGEEQPTLDELDRIARTSGKGLDWLMGAGSERHSPAVLSGMPMRNLGRQGRADRPAMPRSPKIIDDI
jgi:hypothetical protein